MLHAAVAVLTWNVVVFVREIGGLHHHSHSWRRFCGWRWVFWAFVSSLSPPLPHPLPAPCSHYFPSVVIFPLTWNLLGAGFMLLLLTVIMLCAAIVVLTSSLLFVIKVQCTKFLEGFLSLSLSVCLSVRLSLSLSVRLSLSLSVCLPVRLSLSLPFNIFLSTFLASSYLFHLLGTYLVQDSGC